MITEHETIEDVGTDKATSKVDLEFFIKNKLRDSALKREQLIIIFDDALEGQEKHHYEHKITPDEMQETDEELWSSGELNWINGIFDKIMRELKSHGFVVDSAKIDISVSYKEAD